VGLVVRDVTRLVKTGTGSQQNDHIQGRAHVTVTSRANGKSVSGDTNEAPALRHFAEDDSS